MISSHMLKDYNHFINILQLNKIQAYYQNNISAMQNKGFVFSVFILLLLVNCHAKNQASCSIGDDGCSGNQNPTQIKHFQYLDTSESTDDKNKNIISANTFYLTVQFEDQKLTFNLRDYMNWIIYKKVYTNLDIGKQINRRVLMTDIVSAFCQKDEQAGLQNNQIKSSKNVIKYNFGEVFNFGEKSSSFKIQKGGIITILTQIWTRTQKSEVLSILKLQKVTNMNEIQIYATKSQLQKRQLLQILNNQIESLKKENTDLKNSIIQMKRQILHQLLFDATCRNSQIVGKSTIKTQSDQNHKIALVYPYFNNYREFYRAQFNIQVVVGNIGVGLCVRELAAKQDYTSRQGIYMIMSSGNTIPPSQQNKPFEYNAQKIEVQVNTLKNLIQFKKGSQIYQMHYPKHITNQQLTFCASLQKKTDQVIVRGIGYVRIQV